MPIFIAKTYDGKVESVILAKTADLAQAYWQGKGMYPHTIDIRTEEDLKDHITGVLPIVHTRKIDGYEIGRYSNNKKYLVISNE